MSENAQSDKPEPHHVKVVRIAKEIKEELPVPIEYPRKGRIWPTANATMLLRRANWPFHSVILSIPQREHRGVRSGQQTGNADQPASVVPEVWLRELAKRMGVPLKDLVRGKVEDE